MIPVFRRASGNPVAALVGANDDLDGFAEDGLAHPVGYLVRVGSDLAFHLGRADVAVIDRWIEGRVAASLFPGVVSGCGIRADRQHLHRDSVVLKILTPYLGHERYRRTQHNGQLARGRQLFYDPKRYAGLSSSAGQNDLSTSFTHRQSATLGAFLFSEYADAVGDGFGLHTGFRLPPFIAIGVWAVGVWLTVFAFLVLEVSLPLLMQVVRDVDQFERLPLHCYRLLCAAGNRIVAVGDDPAFGPEVRD